MLPSTRGERLGADGAPRKKKRKEERKKRKSRKERKREKTKKKILINDSLRRSGLPFIGI